MSCGGSPWSHHPRGLHSQWFALSCHQELLLEWCVSSLAPSRPVRLLAFQPCVLGWDLQHQAANTQLVPSGFVWGHPRDLPRLVKQCWNAEPLGGVRLLHCNSLAGECGLRYWWEAFNKTCWMEEPLREEPWHSCFWILLGCKHIRVVFLHQGWDTAGCRRKQNYEYLCYNSSHLPLGVCPMNVYIQAGYIRMPLM